MIEKILVEICAGYAEGKSITRLSKELQIRSLDIKAVLRENGQLKLDE